MILPVQKPQGKKSSIRSRAIPPELIQSETKGKRAMSDFEDLLKRVEQCSKEEKQQIFETLREEILLHGLEEEFNARAEVILEGIRRSSDLTKRGGRGVIAEATFVLEILPQLSGWKDMTEEGEFPHDALIENRVGRQARIQVKMQRQKEHRPMWANEGYRDLPKDAYVVEVQRTRGGKRKDGTKTRPYRFGEFDVLAVCMEPSAGDWTRFMYAPANLLQPDPKDPDVIRKFQAVPKETDVRWADNLSECMDRWERSVPNETGR